MSHKINVSIKNLNICMGNHQEDDFDARKEMDDIIQGAVDQKKRESAFKDISESLSNLEKELNSRGRKQLMLINAAFKDVTYDKHFRVIVDAILHHDKEKLTGIQNLEEDTNKVIADMLASGYFDKEDTQDQQQA